MIKQQAKARWKRNERAMTGFGLIGIGLASMAFWVAMCFLIPAVMHFIINLPILTD